MKTFASILWTLSERSGVGLGPLAPHVFAMMIGCKKYERVK